ncbi:hypothetical protein ACTMU2_26935 [Cupriavidus basilensis]
MRARAMSSSVLFAMQQMQSRLTGAIGSIRGSADSDRRRGQADFRRQPRPVAPQRGTGGLAGGNRGQHGAAHQHRAPERRQCAPGQPPGRRRVGDRRARRQHRQPWS